MNATEQDVKAGSTWKRIWATLVFPRRLPGLVRPDFPWLDVLLISTGIAILGAITVPDEYFLQAMRDPVSRRGEPVELTSSSETVATWGRGMAILATIATHPVVAAALAGALLLVFTTFLRGPATFREFLAFTSHGLLIPAVGTLLTVAVRLTTDATTIGNLLFGEVEPANFITALTLSIDPFVVWMLIVLGIWVHQAHGRWTTPRVTILLLGTYLVLLMASTAVLYPDRSEQTSQSIFSPLPETSR